MKTYYKHDSIKNCTLTTLKSLVEMYRDDGYIDEDSAAHVLYKDGTILNYPDDVEQIKFKNIKNIHYMGSDDSRDFTYDDIVTPDDLETIKMMNQLYPMEYQNQLIVEDMDDYYKEYFAK